MGLDSALTSAMSGLRVNQESLSVVSQNIVNANTADYTRRIVTQKNSVLNGESFGVEVASIQRAADSFLVESSRAQISNVGRDEATTDFFSRTEIFFGQPGSNNSVDSYIEGFFSSLSQLSSNPEQAFLRSNALETGIKLTQKVSELATNLETVRFQVEQEIDSTIKELNANLRELKNLNASIKEANRLGTDTSSLLDARDSSLRKVSKIIDVGVSFSSNGEVTIFLPKMELLSAGQTFKIKYTPLTSAKSFINGDPTSAITSVLLDDNGNETTSVSTLLSASNATTKEQNFTSGRLKGLIDFRDTEIPQITSQLDELADTIKNSFNAIHNDGGGFPPPSTLTGTRSVKSTDQNLFSGKVRLAVLKADGTPASSAFGATAGMPPLTIDLSKLDSGNGAGVASMQDIVDEINGYYGPPAANKVSLGNLDDIKLGTVSSSIASTKATGTFVFTGNPGVGDTVAIEGITYTFIANGTPSSGTNIELGTTVSGTMINIASHLSTVVTPSIAAATYKAVTNTLVVTHKTSGTAPNGVFTLDANVTNGGGTVKINAGADAANPPATTMINGVNANGNLEFDFEFTNISGSNSTFEVLSVAVDNGAAGYTGAALPAAFTAFTAPPGERIRTDAAGVSNDTITVDLTGSTQGEGGTHVVTVQIRVTDGATVSTDTVDFLVTIPDPTDNIKNDRIPVRNPPLPVGGGNAKVTAQLNNSRFATASIVDANGNTVSAGTAGFLQITTNQTGLGIVFDEMDSKEGGVYNNAVATKTDRGFSHFFGLNDFFETGSTLKNSAINFDVRSAYKTDPSKFATGELILSNQPADLTSSNPIYTYEMGRGANQVITRLSTANLSRVNFDNAGGLSALTVTFGEYASEIISFNATRASNAESSKAQEQLLFEAFDNRLQSQGGVNVDEELASTIMFQNNYTASARMVNVISDLFKTLLDLF